MAQDHIQTIKDWYKAYVNRDLPALIDHLDPQVEWNAAENFIYSDHSPYIGIEAVKTIHDRLAADWSDFSMSADEILGAGNLVIARGRFRGTFKPTEPPSTPSSSRCSNSQATKSPESRCTPTPPSSKKPSPAPAWQESLVHVEQIFFLECFQHLPSISRQKFGIVLYLLIRNDIDAWPGGSLYW